MDREQMSINELTVGNIIGGGILNPYKKTIYLNGAVGSDGNPTDVPNASEPVKTLTNAYNSIGTYNDAIVLQQSSSSVILGSTFNWAKNNCALIGTGFAQMGMRSRISMSTTFTPFLTVSGYGNLFQNLYLTHGTAATDLVGLNITGNYNTFQNVNFATPMTTLQSTAGYIGVDITATGTYFKDCVIGANTVTLTGAYPLIQINTPSNDFSYTIFENCTLLMCAGSTAPVFLNVANTNSPAGQTFVEFRNCRFVATSVNMATKLADAFSFTGGDTCCVMVDANCQFFGVTAITSSAAYVLQAAAPQTATGTATLLAVNP